MPALQVKDCPENVYERLRICARNENRSMSQQALTILEEYLGFRNSSLSPSRASVNYAEKRKRIFEELATLPSLPSNQEAPSTLELLKISREEDTR